MTNDAIDRYEARMTAPRRAFLARESVAQLLDPALLHVDLEAFLIAFAALGVGMTEPVPRWIEGAGRRCLELGYGQLGQSLLKHARHEAGHHVMMIEDTRRLVARRNARSHGTLSADALLARGPTPGVRSYSLLHERTIAGDAPYGQIAIEYEIEQLSVGLGASVLARARALPFADADLGVSFLADHVELDVGHTHFNRRELGRFLSSTPSAEDGLVAAGTGALESYGQFLDDCLTLAKELSAPRPPRAAEHAPIT